MFPEVPYLWLLSILERFKGATYLQLADCYSSIKHPQMIYSMLLMGPRCNARGQFPKLDIIKQGCNRISGSHESRDYMK